MNREKKNPRASSCAPVVGLQGERVAGTCAAGLRSNYWSAKTVNHCGRFLKAPVSKIDVRQVVQKICAIMAGVADSVSTNSTGQVIGARFGKTDSRGAAPVETGRLLDANSKLKQGRGLAAGQPSGVGDGRELQRRENIFGCVRFESMMRGALVLYG